MIEKEIGGKITRLKKIQKASLRKGLEKESKALKLQRETKKVLLSDSITSIS
jgi:hypothetical protein